MKKNNQTFKILLFCFIIILAGVLISIFSDSNQSELLTIQESKPAPDFTLPTLDKQELSLSSYKGKIVFVNFWATWCSPCKAEMPSMQRLYMKFKDRPFEILAVSLDRGNESYIRDFVKQTKCTFPILRDPKEEVSKNLYKITGVPESYIIDKKGNIVKHVVGSFEWDSPKIIQFFEKLISES